MAYQSKYTGTVIDESVDINTIQNNNIANLQSQINTLTNQIMSLNNSISSYWETIYPVGSIYMSLNSTSPATLFGGTWSQMKDRFLIGAGNSYSLNTTGGATTSKIQEKNIPVMPVWMNYKPGGNYSRSKNDTSAYVVHIGMQGTATTVYPASTTGVWPVNGMQYGNRGYDAHVGCNDSEALSIMPPYIAVYIWKRTA